MKQIVFFIIIVFLNYDGFSQKFKYKNVDNIYSNFTEPADINTFVPAEEYLPKNYVTDGSSDYTEYIQQAIDENLKIKLPNFPIKINENGLLLKSNTELFFDKKSKLILLPNDKTHYGMLTLKKVKNIIVYNPHLEGDRDEHLSKEGQWGMGIRIHDSQHIKVYNSNIYNMWGDGIYITSYSNTNKSNDILIKYGLINNVRRNGISIISGQNIIIDSIQIANTNGHKPASGIDIEPNTKNDVLKNINIKNVFTYNNELDGITMGLNNLINSEIKNEIGVSIDSHKDIGSRLGLNIHKLKNIKDADYQLEGVIKIENAVWLNTKSKNTIMIRPETELLPNIQLKNIKTNNMNQKSFDKKIDKMIESRKQFKYIKN